MRNLLRFAFPASAIPLSNTLWNNDEMVLIHVSMCLVYSDKYAVAHDRTRIKIFLRNRTGFLIDKHGVKVYYRLND